MGTFSNYVLLFLFQIAGSASVVCRIYVSYFLLYFIFIIKCKSLGRNETGGRTKPSHWYFRHVHYWMVFG